MLGRPKFKRGDTVSFKYPSEGHVYTGTVEIIDKYGTFENPKDVSYDVLVTNDPRSKDGICLHKHLTETLLS